MPIVFTRDLGYAGAGASQAHLMEDASGNRYFVKFKENAQLTPKILVNEFVAGRLATHLSLPCAECDVAEVDPLLASSILINGVPISTGPHFASKQIDNVYKAFFLRSLIAQCSNKGSFPGIATFDGYTYNVDRNNDGNYLIVATTTGLHFYIIDHGHCFLANWTIAVLQLIVDKWTPPDTILRELYNEITDPPALLGAADDIGAIPDDFIANLVNQIPDDWLPDTPERDELLRYLITKRPKILDLVSNLQTTLFPNCK